jgi:hypothetical protein
LWRGCSQNTAKYHQFALCELIVLCPVPCLFTANVPVSHRWWSTEANVW